MNLGSSFPGSFTGSSNEKAAGKVHIPAEQDSGTENKIIENLIVQFQTNTNTQLDLFLDRPEFNSSATPCKQPSGLPPTSGDF